MVPWASPHLQGLPPRPLLSLSCLPCFSFSSLPLSSLSLSLSLDQQEHQPHHGWGARSLCTSGPPRIDPLTLEMEPVSSDPPLPDRATGHHRRCLPVPRW
ncbi:hypothetical protein D1007_15003 [Hordeum vulgare]|nr:hypothetical protein D1007_15003 [Hordeum vulgare]